jgi:hypothetical protein
LVPFTHVPAGLAVHPVAERGRVRQAGGDDVAWGHLRPARDGHLVRAVEAELVQRFQGLDEVVTEPVLERDPPGVHPARDQQNLLVLDVDALDRADALGEVEDLGLAEGCRGEPAPALLPDDRRIEAFLDGGPDGEGRGEVVAVDGEVRTVADADLLDRVEQFVRRVPGEHVREPRLDPHADKRQPPGLLPVRGTLELRVAELDPALLVGALAVRLRQ